MTAYIIGAVQTIVISLMLFYWQRNQKKRDIKAEEMQKKRTEESLLQLEMSSANGELSFAVAVAIKRGHANGEVESAVDAYKQAKSKYYHFLNTLAMENKI